MAKGGLAEVAKPPPVPPKDFRYTVDMEEDTIAVSPPSGSKRKRDAHDEDAHGRGLLDNDDPDAHTPKRTRSQLRQSDASASEDNTPNRSRNLRRQKKVGNLSNLNLRHAAERQAAAEQASLQPRESRFLEGSLNDRPSEKPPSFFTRMIRTDSGNVLQVEELMTDYYNGLATPGDSVEPWVDQPKAAAAPRTDGVAAPSAKKEESSSFFGLGLTFSFRPIALWKQLWNETKAEMTRENMEEYERKKRQKAEAEAKYAEMKHAGQLELQPVSHTVADPRSSRDSATPRDSAVVMDSTYSSFDYKRTVSGGSQLLPPQRDDTTSHSGSDVQETASKPSKGFKSRFHFKRPSMSNLKDGLKRVTSDLNLAATANRESSSSMSPVKTDFDGPTLRKSNSRYDLKKQSKLSKRVSDLEAKLYKARHELDEALVDASPMPKLGNKYERFTPTPNATIRRPKFVPGALPSLPSERILMAEQFGFGEEEIPMPTEAKPRSAIDLTEGLNDDKVGTIRASANEDSHPARASSLFQFPNGNIEHLADDKNHNHLDKRDDQTSELTSLLSEMDPNSTVNFTSDGAAEPAKGADYASLDAKLKALDKQVKATAKKPGKQRKRKSGISSDDKMFKPATDDDDDAEWADADGTPRKKRKSGGKPSSSPQVKRSREQKSSPRGKVTARGGSKKKVDSASQEKAAKVPEQAVQPEPEVQGDEDVEIANGDVEADEPADSAPSRNSLDSQGGPLDPVYEEEEETSIVRLNDEPSKPTAKATPARYGRRAGRSRSTSPNKRTAPGTEETMMTRAAEAAQQHPGRRGRSVSPFPVNGYKAVLEHETVTVMPGGRDVPSLPKGANGSFESLVEVTVAGAEEGEVVTEVTETTKTGFEWPEDVF